MTIPTLIYKIATEDVLEASKRAGDFVGMPIDLKDGYVHFSTAAQLAETLRLHFAGQADLVVFAVPTNGLGDLRWEQSRGGQSFPHLYGALPMAAMTQSAIISVAADGAVALPDWVK